MSTGRNRIRAVVRCRPVTDDDYQSCKTQRHLLGICVGVKPDKRSVVVTKDSFVTKETKVDQAYGVSADQEHLYERACKDIVADAFAGYHGSILSYGQTGSGKTYTMFGSGYGFSDKGSMEPTPGMVQFAMKDLFALMAERHDDGYFSAMEMSMFQIYQEGITDLLVSTSDKVYSASPFSPSAEKDEDLTMFQLKQRGLDIREYPDKSVVIDGLSRFPVAELDAAMSLLSVGLANRITRSVTANEQSSRSHVILQLTLTCQESVRDGTHDQKIRTSNLMCVDLAGSERIRKSGSINNTRTMNEAQSINKSISNLGLCIHTLASAGDRGVKAAHVPFRNSKLTRILADAIGGNSRACIIATIGPCLYNVEETLSTLQFSKRCTSVKKTIRRVKAKLPDLFDDKLIAWTWNKSNKSSSDEAGELNDTEAPCSGDSHLNPIEGETPSPASPVARLFESSPVSLDTIDATLQHDNFECMGSSPVVVKDTCPAVTPQGGAVTQWVRYSADTSGINMFTVDGCSGSGNEDSPVINEPALHSGLLVLFPDFSLSGNTVNTITMDRAVSTKVGNGASCMDVSVSVKVSPGTNSFPAEVDPSNPQTGFDYSGNSDTDLELQEAEALFRLYDDDDDGDDFPDGHSVGDNGPFSVSSSSVSPVSLDESGDVSPRALTLDNPLATSELMPDGEGTPTRGNAIDSMRNNDSAQNSSSPLSRVTTDSCRPGDNLWDPEDDRAPLCSTEIPKFTDHNMCRPPPLELLNAATTGINSPKMKDRKSVEASSNNGWLSELVDIFDGEQDMVKSPERKLLAIAGTPPVIPKLDIPSPSDSDVAFGVYSCGSGDSDELWSDRSDLMAKMTDSPPKGMTTKVLSASVQESTHTAQASIEKKIETIESTQKTINFIVRKLQELYLDGERKLADLRAMQDDDILRVSSSDSEDEGDEILSSSPPTFHSTLQPDDRVQVMMPEIDTSGADAGVAEGGNGSAIPDYSENRSPKSRNENIEQDAEEISCDSPPSTAIPSSLHRKISDSLLQTSDRLRSPSPTRTLSPFSARAIASDSDDELSDSDLSSPVYQCVAEHDYDFPLEGLAISLDETVSGDRLDIRERNNSKGQRQSTLDRQPVSTRRHSMSDGNVPRRRSMSDYLISTSPTHKGKSKQLLPLESESSKRSKSEDSTPAEDLETTGEGGRSPYSRRNSM